MQVTTGYQSLYCNTPLEEHVICTEMPSNHLILFVFLYSLFNLFNILNHSEASLISCLVELELRLRRLRDYSDYCSTVVSVTTFFLWTAGHVLEKLVGH